MAKAGANTPLTMPATDAQVDPEHDHEAQAVTSLADHSNPEWIAKQHDFVVGKLVQEKCAIGKAFKITSIDTNGVQLQLVGSYSEEVFEPAVELQELIAGFKPFPSHPPEKLAVEQMTINSVHKTVVRAMIWQKRQIHCILPLFSIQPHAEVTD